MRILVAEDDAHVGDSLLTSLRRSGHAVDRVASGVEAERALEASAFDLLILDIGLPGRSGLEVLRDLRARDSKMPVLLLTARDSVGDRVKGLDAGADDYLAKPFEIAELQARVRALTRRGGGAPLMMKHGPLAYDLSGRVAWLHGTPLELSGREVNLLEILLQRAGRMVSKEQLIDLLCEWGEEVSGNAIEVYIHRLRKKLEPGGVHIATVRGIGYTLSKPAAVA
jgi:two-component system OmpR family response regulator